MKTLKVKNAVAKVRN